MSAQRLAGICASLVLTLAGFALVAWWLMWPVWSRPPPAMLPPPLSLLLHALAALSLLARARGRPSGWSSAPALLLIVLGSVLLLEAGADLRSGLARLLSPDAVRRAALPLWRPSLLLAGQSILLGAALWSVHGRRKPGFDLGDGLALAAAALALALVVREPGGAAVAALLIAAGVILLDSGRGLPALARRVRMPRRRQRAGPAPPETAAARAELPAAATEQPPEPDSRKRMARLPPAAIDPKTGLYTEAGWKQFLIEEDARCAIAGASGCVLVLEPKPNDDVAAIEQVPAVLRGAARQGDVMTRSEEGFVYLAVGCPPEHAPPLLAKLRGALARAHVQIWIGIAMRDLNQDFPSTVQEAIESKNQLRASSTGMQPAQR